MVDIHSANRRFERFLMSHGYDPAEPLDDRKTSDDICRYPRVGRHVSTEGCKLIATITYRPDTQEIIVKRNDE
jgi:hypothetical protein